MKSGDAFVLVFSLTSMETLNELSNLRDQILRLKEVDGYTAVGCSVLTLLVPRILTYGYHLLRVIYR